MRVSRVLGTVGRFLMGAGVVMLLFVVYQLWGTGLQHARAQDDLADEFVELLEIAPPEADLVATSTETASDQALVDPPVADVPAAEVRAGEVPAGEVPAEGEASGAGAASSFDDADRRYIDLLYPSNGEVLGRIEIPRIGLDEFFVEGVRVPDLRKGPGHYDRTPLPGQAGNAAIAGHRTTYGAPFHRVDELEPGDEIVVTTLQGSFTYRVMPQIDGSGDTSGHFIVSPDDTQVLDDFGDNRLTLTACHPKFSARQRIIVVAELVDEPEPTLPRPEELAALDAAAGPTDSAAPDPGVDGGLGADDVPGVGTELPDVGDQAVVAAAAVPGDSFGQGLNGDRSAIPAAISWGLAAAVLWFTAGFVGRRWRLLPSYALAILPVAMLMFVSFVHIDQALPSY